MRTIFVTGSDTGIGKSHVTAAIARLLSQPDLRIQFVKPVETGRSAGEPGDASDAALKSGIAGASHFTLVRFDLPLAPLAAAEAEGKSLPMSLLLDRWRELPPADLRIVEGAGGIAVPIDPDGRDWRDFAHGIHADRVVLVVPDRLGAINQARLTLAYSRKHDIPAGIWLNENEVQSDQVRQSNRQGLSGLPVWATQRFNAELPENPGVTVNHLAAVAE